MPAARATKRLRSVIHSIAHHAMSGLCYVHPHLGEQCKKAAVREAEIDVLNGELSSEKIPETEPLSRSVAALSKKFVSILASEGLSLNDVKEVSIRFQFGGSRWPTSCYAVIRDARGDALDVALSSSGRKAEMLHAPSERE